MVSVVSSGHSDDAVLPILKGGFPSFETPCPISVDVSGRQKPELNGENGAVFFDLEDPHILQYFRYADPATGKKIEDHLTGWQRIHVTNFEHPYMRNWWVPGCTIGYEHTFINGLADFLASLEGGPAFHPNMREALRTQRVCDAVLESAERGQWVEIGT